MKEIKEMSIGEKFELYRVAGKCPAVAVTIGKEQGLGKYPFDSLRRHYARTADTIFQLHFQTNGKKKERKRGDI